MTQQDEWDVRKAVFAKRLQIAVSESGLAKAKIADALGINIKTLARLTHMKCWPRLDIALGLADVLGVSLDWLMGRDDDWEMYDPATQKRYLKQLCKKLEALIAIDEDDI